LYCLLLLIVFLYSLHSHFIICIILYLSLFFFFFNDTATTEIYTLSLHDALPISLHNMSKGFVGTRCCILRMLSLTPWPGREAERSEEHTSELQSLAYLVCRLLLEKKKKKKTHKKK